MLESSLLYVWFKHTLLKQYTYAWIERTGDLIQAFHADLS